MPLAALMIYDRSLFSLPKDAALKKTRVFGARFEEACVLPYFVPGVGVVKVLRPPELVTAPSRIAAYENLVVCDGHPPEGKAHQLGKGIVRDAIADGLGIGGSVVIHDEALLAKIYSGVVELSPGYKGDLIEDSGEFRGVSYTYRHANYFWEGVERLEHLAVVPTGRHGSAAAITIQDASIDYAIALDWDAYQAKPIVIDRPPKCQEQKEEVLMILDEIDPAVEAAIEEPIIEAVDEVITEVQDAPATDATLDMVVEMLKDLKDLINQPCPTCAAEESDKESAPISDALIIDAMPEIITLDRQARSVGLEPTAEQLANDRRGVRKAIATKLGVMITDSMGDEMLAGMVAGAIAAKPKTVGIKSAASAHKAAQLPVIGKPVAAVDHPMAGLY